MTRTMLLTAVLHQEDDLYVAECPEIGTVSQGYTVEEAIANLREATELYVSEFPVQESKRPLLTTVHDENAAWRWALAAAADWDTM